MKRLLTTILSIMAGLTLYQPLVYAGIEVPVSLITYESNASTTTLLVDDEGNIQGSAIADLTDIKNIGHPGNLETQNSEVVLFANALRNFQEQHSELFDNPPRINLKGALTGIAGYDKYKSDTLANPYRGGGETTKSQYFTDASKAQLDSLWFNFPDSSPFNLISDGELIAYAAKYAQTTPTPYQNVDVVQLTTCAVSYRVRNGRLVPGSSLSPDTDTDGGTFQLGQLVKNHFNAVPDNCPAAFKFDDDILDAMANSIPVVDQYQELPLWAFLAIPPASVKLLSELPTKKYQHYFRRLKSGFVNEKGYAVLQARLKFGPPAGISPERWYRAQKKLNAYIEGVVDQIAALIDKAREKNPSSESTPLVLLGEFPLQQLGMESHLKAKISSTTDRKRLQVMPEDRFLESLAKAGIELLYSPQADSSSGHVEKPEL